MICKLKLGITKSELEIARLQNPGARIEQVGSSLVKINPDNTIEQIFSAPTGQATEITDVGGKRVLLDKGTGMIIKDLGESPVKNKSFPPGYEESSDGKGVQRIPGYKDTQLEMDMRKEFDGVSKDFRSVRDSYNRMQTSANNPSPAGDLSVIFNYMKMLDPNSVVRESEFATAAATGSFGDRIKGAVAKVITGERLDPAIRADFLDRSRQLYNEQEQTFQSLSDNYSETAKRNGLDPQNIILTPRQNPRKDSGNNGGIAPEAIQMLKSDPSTASDFDAMFGQGAAAKILGVQ